MGSKFDSVPDVNIYLGMGCINVIMIFVSPGEVRRCCIAQIIGRGSYALYTMVLSALTVAE